MNRVSGSSSQKSSRRHSVTAERRGAMLVFIAVAMVGLLGFLAMTLDVGAGSRQRRIAQTAADAGALGGAAEIYRLSDDATVVAAAQAEAVRNGFAVSEITVNRTPTTGSHVGDSKFVEVIINKSIPTIFGSLFSVSSLAVSARAVAGVGSHSLTCLYSLEPTGSKALEVDNGGELTTNCGVSINSTNSNAVDVNNSGQLGTGEGTIGISGGWTGNKPPTPTPSTGIAPVPNPLASISMPSTVPACTTTGLVTVTKDTTLTSGVFCGGIYIGNKTATFTAGTYIIRGGGFEVHGGRMLGTGITIINSIDPTAVYAFKPITFGNGCQTTISAPTTGTYAGVLMFADPAGPADIVNTYACASDTPPELTGTLYFPTQKFVFNGSNSGTQLLGTIIAKKVEIGGKVTIVNQTGVGTAVQRKVLVE
jgi:hypothetical protein